MTGWRFSAASLTRHGSRVMTCFSICNAPVLRHAATQGALSSRCLKFWGIRPVLLPLTATVAGASVGLLAILLDQDEPSGDNASTTD
jgi:hypothetical protein